MGQKILYVGEILSDSENYFIVNTDKVKNIRVSGTDLTNTEIIRSFFLEQVNSQHNPNFKTFSVLYKGVEIFKTIGESKESCLDAIKSGKYKTDRKVTAVPSNITLKEI